MFCPKCGINVTEGMTACPVCGHWMEGEPPAQETVTVTETVTETAPAVPARKAGKMKYLLTMAPAGVRVAGILVWVLTVAIILMLVQSYHLIIHTSYDEIPVASMLMTEGAKEQTEEYKETLGNAIGELENYIGTAENLTEEQHEALNHLLDSANLLKEEITVNNINVVTKELEAIVLKEFGEDNLADLDLDAMGLGGLGLENLGFGFVDHVEDQLGADNVTPPAGDSDVPPAGDSDVPPAGDSDVPPADEGDTPPADEGGNQLGDQEENKLSGALSTATLVSTVLDIVMTALMILLAFCAVWFLFGGIFRLNGLNIVGLIFSVLFTLPFCPTTHTIAIAALALVMIVLTAIAHSSYRQYRKS